MKLISLITNNLLYLDFNRKKSLHSSDTTGGSGSSTPTVLCLEDSHQEQVNPHEGTVQDISLFQSAKYFEIQENYSQAILYYKSVAFSSFLDPVSSSNDIQQSNHIIDSNHVLELQKVSLFKLGHFNHHGLGTVKNINHAMTFYTMAAEMGHVPAQNMLGQLFYNGYKNEIQVDFEKAAGWFRKASLSPSSVTSIDQNDDGSLVALYSLGVCFEKGRGVGKDKLLALQCYEKAAGKGHLKSLERLKDKKFMKKAACMSP